MSVRSDAKKRIDDLISSLPEFSKEICFQLRRLIFQAEPGMTEDWKWGPNYQYPEGKMVCGFGAFKGWVTFTFFQGFQMRDPKKLFNYGDVNAHNRSIKFVSAKDIDEKVITEYIREAVSINKSGKTVAINNAKNKVIYIPVDLKKVLKENGLLEKFEKLPFTHRKEYIVWIEDAKKKETRERRLRQAIEQLSKS